MADLRQSRSSRVIIDLVSDDDDSPPSTSNHGDHPRFPVTVGSPTRLANEGPAVPANPTMIRDNGGRSQPQVTAAARDLSAAPSDFDFEQYLSFPEHDAAPPNRAAPIDDFTASFDHPSDLTAHTCLQKVLEIFPDVDHAHVLQLFDDFDTRDGYQNMSGLARFEQIIDQLVSSCTYPKQVKVKQTLKRKRDDSDDDDDSTIWKHADRTPPQHSLSAKIRAMLKAEFPDFPVAYIQRLLHTHKHLYPTYLQMAAIKDGERLHVRRGRPPAPGNASAVKIATESNLLDVLDELKAARKHVVSYRTKRDTQERLKQVEADNLQHAIQAGETAECQACFDDLPMNRQIHCDGDVAHFTCFSCAETYLKTEIGESRCRLLCTAGCGSPFAPGQLNCLPNRNLLAKFAQLQQEKDIRDAGLEDLEECPFCDFKAIVPPIDEDFEFRCHNTECEKTSCRRCRLISHIPMSCEQFAKDNKLSVRHKIEEAMTAALVRTCKKCKRPFVKELGCNKMTCPSCGNIQCYICSETVKGYEHFDQVNRSQDSTVAIKCPLHDDVDVRHKREVKEAEEAERAKIMLDNPDITPLDLEINNPPTTTTAPVSDPHVHAPYPGMVPNILARARERGEERREERREAHVRERARIAAVVEEWRTAPQHNVLEQKPADRSQVPMQQQARLRDKYAERNQQTEPAIPDLALPFAGYFAGRFVPARAMAAQNGNMIPLPGTQAGPVFAALGTAPNDAYAGAQAQVMQNQQGVAGSSTVAPAPYRVLPANSRQTHVPIGYTNHLPDQVNDANYVLGLLAPPNQTPAPAMGNGDLTMLAQRRQPDAFTRPTGELQHIFDYRDQGLHQPHHFLDVPPGDGTFDFIQEQPWYM